MDLVEERPRAGATARPRFSHTMEPLALQLPAGKRLGPAIACVRDPRNGEFIVLHHGDMTGRGDPAILPQVVRFTPDLEFIEAWGGPDHVPAVGGVSQWPTGPEGLECDAEGHIWIFGYQALDSAVLRFSPRGELVMRIGQRETLGDDDSTTLLGRGPTSCWHDVANREVFISDGYSNHRVIAFNSETGAFTRMWGAYGKRPSQVPAEESYANPVHKVARGPDGLLYVCDRIKGRVQAFELIPGGVRFVREVVLAPGTWGFGAAFDIGFSPDGAYAYVADGANAKMWVLRLADLELLGWTLAVPEPEGEANEPAWHRALHRMWVEANGDILLACTQSGFRRMRYLGVS
jgi:hypothetical protein